MAKDEGAFSENVFENFYIKKVFFSHGGLEATIQTECGKYTITLRDFRRIGEDVLCEGNSLGSEVLEDLEFSSQKLSCIQKSLKLLEYGDMSEKRLKMKLYGKFDKSVIDSAIEVLKENGYIDDERLARNLCEEYFFHGRLSKMAIKAKLYEKGFNRDTVTFVFDEFEFDEETTYSNMRSLVCSKYGECLDKETKVKALQYLVRRGYGYEESKSLLDNI